jgi:tetratricopeptide (TPR) repeat protein
MAIQEQKPMSTAPSGPSGPHDRLSPAVRKRLEDAYKRALQNAQTGNFDYATELFSQCVVGDMGNQLYTQGFLTNLQKKYSSSKKGSTLSSIRTAGSKASMMNASRKKDWPGLIRAGMEVLKVNPWDVSALLQIAKACGDLGFVECQLVYLKAAQDTDPKSIEVNKECALALEKVSHLCTTHAQKMVQFDQAIACWSRVIANAKSASAEHDEANREIARLQVEKTMLSSTVKDASKSETKEEEQEETQFRASSASATPTKRTRTEELEEKIAANPTEYMLYMELADLHSKNEKWNDAQSILTRGLEATGGDLRLREQLEELQVREALQRVVVADKRARESPGPEAKEQVQKLRAELNRIELDLFRKRVERYPTNTHFKYELAARLKLAGNYSEAIKSFQEAKNDPKHKGVVKLDLGECFQQIKQYPLAMQHYQQAIEEIPEKDVEHRKKALYRAGCLSQGLNEIEAAEKHFTQLAAMDFAYKDVSARLDKIAEARNKG